MPTYSELEEDLLQQQQEEEERAQALEEQNQIDRMEAQEEANQQSPVNQAADLAKDYAKGIVKKAAKEEALAAASTAGSAIVASAPVWGPIVGIIAIIGLVIGLGLFVIISLTSACNAGGLSGFAARWGSWGASFLPGVSQDVCASLAIDNGGRSGGAGASGAFDKLDIQLTSAYRPGSIVEGTNTLSAHSRGEAVDIAFRNPVATSGSDPRIAELIRITKTMGFTGPGAGAEADTLDEYTNPTEGATGGHIHIEFNTKSDGTTFCDGSKVVNPPNDLVDIPASIPRSGVSNPKLRPCMLSKVEAIFYLAGVTSSN